MRIRYVVPIVGLAVACGAVSALAAHPTVDPATVPTGILQAHTTVNNIPVATFTKALRSRKADVFIEHGRLDPGQSTGFHTHPGPAFVTVVRGSLVDESLVARQCRRKNYVAGTGFVDRGAGYPHRAVAGAAGADFYVVYLLPRRTGPHRADVSPPSACAL